MYSKGLTATTFALPVKVMTLCCVSAFVSFGCMYPCFPCCATLLCSAVFAMCCCIGDVLLNAYLVQQSRTPTIRTQGTRSQPPKPPQNPYVTRVLRKCYKSVTKVIQKCYNSVTRVLQRCYKSVTILLQDYYKSVTRRGVTRRGVTHFECACASTPPVMKSIEAVAKFRMPKRDVRECYAM
jgi:hypothetical protein